MRDQVTALGASFRGRSRILTRLASNSRPSVLVQDRLDGPASTVPSTDSGDGLINDGTVETGLRYFSTGLLRHVREFAPGVSADGQKELVVGLTAEHHRSEPAVLGEVDEAAVNGLLEQLAQRGVVVVHGHGAGHGSPLVRYCKQGTTLVATPALSGCMISDVLHHAQPRRPRSSTHRAMCADLGGQGLACRLTRPHQRVRQDSILEHASRGAPYRSLEVMPRVPTRGW